MGFPAAPQHWKKNVEGDAMKSDFRELKLSDLSDVQVDYFFGPSKTVESRDMIIIKYSGEYGFGSAGNSDAVYMKAMGRAALEAWKPDVGESGCLC